MQPGKPLPGIRSLMAVINSVGVGRGSKSVGEFTYRYTRGRTIASRRITKNTSKTPAQVGRRGAFGSFVWMFSPYKWFFSDGYEKTKHGSSFNQFVHVNRELLGKSPYNSEVNKKLIPNGTQLWKLINTISSPDLLHLSVKSKTGSARNKFLSENYDACLKWWWNDTVKGYGTVGAAIQRICTTTDPANENPFTPVVGDLQPVENSYDESTGILTLAVRVREGIKRMNLSLIACMDTGFVNLASFNLTPSSSSSSDTPGTVTPDPAPTALDEGIELLDAQNPATGVTVDSDGATVTVTIDAKAYIRSVTTLAADTSYGVIPSLKVNDRLISVYRAPGVHVTTP